ncbi:PTS transporter subunit EIIC, partial [Synergistaceae bacterium OttesenSCG-928-I11]|nr:PTS transporter subunit EIIC [Synergistaceae bacterium OttesenSCG-928-I11]
MQPFGHYNKFLGTSFWVKISTSTYLGIVRNALTLTLPVVIAGAAAVLINNFPIEGYQRLMLSVFGPNWRLFGGYVWNGTLTVLSPVMVFTIGHSIAEHYNAKHPLDAIHPIILGLVSFCSLMAIIEPAKAVFAVPYQWIGIHGLFLAIIVAVVSSELFLLLYGLKTLRVRFYSEEASAIIVGAFSSLIPGMLTIFAFAGFKILSLRAGIPDVHHLIYEFLYLPFRGMGNTLSTAILYNFVRHLLWFIGIHGSNALEPVMTEIYVIAMKTNEFAMVAGEPLPFVFTKTFFDSFISIGGAGGTLSLLLAFALRRKDNSMMRIGQISLLPAIFNINETLLFGLPIVLNPIFLVPFLLVPIITTLTSYYAMRWGFVPIPMVDVAWTTPAFIGGYVATGSFSGGLLQLFNVLVGTALYMPFVRIAESVQQYKFKMTYKELLDASGNLGEEARASLVNRTDDVGSVSRSLANDLLQSVKRKELFLEYQPQVDCRTGKVVGVEALLRWMHPRIGRIPPSLFIPLAEEIGFIGEMGLWVCGESCRQLRVWQDKGLTETVMSFNVSVKQLDDPTLPQKILGYIDKYM